MNMQSYMKTFKRFKEIMSKPIKRGAEVQYSSPRIDTKVEIIKLTLRSAVERII